MPLVDPATVADTTADPSWSAVAVTATLATPVVHPADHPLHLDGPASWGAYQQYLHAHGHATLPPMTPTSAVDFTLPLATWTAHGTWGWACSRAHYTPTAHLTLAARRRPAVDEMARYTADAKTHLAAGPLKARDTPLPATLVEAITWYALADPDDLADLLTEHVWALGRHTRHGHGRVQRWTVTPHDGRDAWRARTMPDPGSPTRLPVRAPYHHPTRHVPAREA